MNKDVLGDWLLHWNPVAGVWDAALRSDANALFSDRSKVISSKEIGVLIEVLMRTEGDEDRIKELLNNKV